MPPRASCHLQPRAARGSHSAPGHIRLSGSLRSPQAPRCWGPPAIRAPPQPRAPLGEAAQARWASAFPRRCLWPGTGRSCGLATSRSRRWGSPGSRCLPRSFPRLGGTYRGRAAASPSSEAPRPARLRAPEEGLELPAATPARKGCRPGHAWKPRRAARSFLPCSRGTRLGEHPPHSQGRSRAAFHPPSPSRQASSLEGSSLTQLCARPSGWAVPAQRAPAVGRGAGKGVCAWHPAAPSHHRPYRSVRRCNISSQPQRLL